MSYSFTKFVLDSHLPNVVRAADKAREAADTLARSLLFEIAREVTELARGTTDNTQINSMEYLASLEEENVEWICRALGFNDAARLAYEMPYFFANTNIKELLIIADPVSKVIPDNPYRPLRFLLQPSGSTDPVL